MALYHLKAGVISRSTGRSAVQGIAYATGVKLFEEWRGQPADYTNIKRMGEITYETLAPEHSPEWVKDLNTLWNKVDQFEDKYAEKRYKTPETIEAYKNCCQTAQTIIVALQKELTIEENQNAIRQFSKRFTDRGLIVTYAIHNEEGNPHAHLQITRRALTAEGEFSWTKDREIVSRSEHTITRKLWADLNNIALEKAGFETRIDHRSYAERGIDLMPTKHEGYHAHKLDSLGIQSDLIEFNKEVKFENRERVSFHTNIIVQELTSKQSTFTELHLLRTIQKRVQDDPHLASHVYEQVLKNSVSVGTDLDGQKRLAHSDYVQKEQQLFSAIEHLCQRDSFLSIEASAIEKALKYPEQARLNKGTVANRFQNRKER